MFQVNIDFIFNEGSKFTGEFITSELQLSSFTILSLKLNYQINFHVLFQETGDKSCGSYSSPIAEWMLFFPRLASAIRLGS